MSETFVILVYFIGVMAVFSPFILVMLIIGQLPGLNIKSMYDDPRDPKFLEEMKQLKIKMEKEENNWKTWHLNTQNKVTK